MEGGAHERGALSFCTAADLLRGWWNTIVQSSNLTSGCPTHLSAPYPSHEPADRSQQTHTLAVGDIDVAPRRAVGLTSHTATERTEGCRDRVEADDSRNRIRRRLLCAQVECTLATDSR